MADFVKVEFDLTVVAIATTMALQIYFTKGSLQRSFCYYLYMYPNTFYRVSVKALIKDKDDRVLVLKENQDTWSLPGGGLDHGEDSKLGILRELREELGVKNPHIKDIGLVKTFYLESKSAWLLWIVYDVQIDTADFIFGEGVTDAQYIDVSELEQSEDVFERMVYSVATKA